MFNYEKMPRGSRHSSLQQFRPVQHHAQIVRSYPRLWPQHVEVLPIPGRGVLTVIAAHVQQRAEERFRRPQLQPSREPDGHRVELARWARHSTKP